VSLAASFRKEIMAMTTHKTHATKPSKSHKAKAAAHRPDAEKPSSSAATPPSTDAFHAALTELEGIRDDVRVRIHLAGMELKNVWSDLDKRYLALRDVATHAKDDALTKARNGLMEIRNELHDLRGRLDRSGRATESDASSKPS
jgi:hypothetical protein